MQIYDLFEFYNCSKELKLNLNLQRTPCHDFKIVWIASYRDIPNNIFCTCKTNVAQKRILAHRNTKVSNISIKIRRKKLNLSYIIFLGLGFILETFLIKNDIKMLYFMRVSLMSQHAAKNIGRHILQQLVGLLTFVTFKLYF